MGVYIPNRELPRHCFGCSTKIDPDNRRCNIDGHLFKETLSKISSRRDEACPLVPVPPHGDLIDRTEAIVDANERAYDFWSSDAEADATVKFLQEQISIIPAEEGE